MLSSAARLRSSSAPSPSTMQVRHFWPCNRRIPDWSSHLDPNYNRFHRQRHLATRAKLLKSIRRRSKWDLGGDNQLFFSPRYVRLASHFYGDGSNRGRRQEKEQEDNDGYELSDREKIWKEQMEHMRKRIETDPYDAIFGRRFRPFWAPFLSTWESAHSTESKTEDTHKQPVAKAETTQTKDTHKQPVVKTETTQTKEAPKQPVAKATQSSQPTSYAYSSSTSWDSWTNKAKGTEWDSISGETKHFEYDPISNRMVEVVKQDAKVDDTSAGPQKELRKAIPIPHQTVHDTNTLDGLTASSIRATMGRPKSENSASSSIQHHHEQELESLRAKKNSLNKEARNGDTARRHAQLDANIQATMAKLEGVKVTPTLTTALQRGATTPKVSQAALRPAVDRMQSKPARDVDESAAHESTGGPTTVPKAWANQASLLQSDRVERTSSKVSFRDPVPKWVHDMADRQDALENDAEARERATKISKADAMLQAEVQEQKNVMQSRERRQTEEHSDIEAKYKAKIAALKQELDIAYQQSSRHADEFRDQIKKASQRSEDAARLEAKYKAKLAAMKENLDIAYKQSSKHADEFKSQIQKLSMTKQTNAISMPKVPITGAEHNLLSPALLKDIRGIYERAYSVLDDKKAPKTQDALAGFDKMTSYDFKQDSLESELAQTTVNDPKLKYKAKLEAELHDRDPYVANDKAGAYKFQKDNLEAELRERAPEADNKDGVYQFREDNLEAELSGRATEAQPQRPELDDISYAFKSDGLEAELKSRSTGHIDGTSAPATGNYASPTGFVNFDPVFPKDKNSSMPRVRREEAVFTGTHRVRHGRDRERRRRSSRARRAVKWLMIGGTVALTGAYIQGMQMEKTEMKRIGSREAWEKMAREYEALGERGVVDALKEMRQADAKWSSGLFWK